MGKGHHWQRLVRPNHAWGLPSLHSLPPLIYSAAPNAVILWKVGERGREQLWIGITVLQTLRKPIKCGFKKQQYFTFAQIWSKNKKKIKEKTWIWNHPRNRAFSQFLSLNRYIWFSWYTPYFVCLFTAHKHILFETGLVLPYTSPVSHLLCIHSNIPQLQQTLFAIRYGRKF